MSRINSNPLPTPAAGSDQPQVIGVLAGLQHTLSNFSPNWIVDVQTIINKTELNSLNPLPGLTGERLLASGIQTLAKQKNEIIKSKTETLLAASTQQVSSISQRRP